MEPKEIIEWNNKKREELTEHNQKIYEEMLIYIRAGSNKSEQQTEEVLLELLEHLLDAQKEGKSAEEIFGSDFKAYCDDIIKEIPGEKKKKKLGFGIYIALKYLAIISGVTGVLGFALSNFFEIGSGEFTFTPLSGTLIIALYLALLFLFIKIALKWIQMTSFSKKKKWIEFVQLWLFCSLYFGLFYLIPKLIPSIGPKISVPVIGLGVLGVVIYIITIPIGRKYGYTN
ncbi:Uncharacterized membrane-anchored protein [Oceanobacillus limi]|uniref:Uncharacterized membrane-anchored protein n=1 Tax=Oceanobacillus limi TaxID=930131 RepID=A0A1I0ASR6_9BACI|nr:DUF1129 family protein [Oceanobacillus limi]SES96953.1 Uncharacterized membrane-anchored protein [Oceanobacillus limi]